MAPKPIKNRSKLSFRTSLFRHPFLHGFLIDFGSQLRPAGFQKNGFSLGNFFFKKSPFEVGIDFGSDCTANLLPCWLQDRRFFEILAFKRP